VAFPPAAPPSSFPVPDAALPFTAVGRPRLQSRCHWSRTHARPALPASAKCEAKRVGCCLLQELKKNVRAIRQDIAAFEVRIFPSG
jgi:hypothetical protein